MESAQLVESLAIVFLAGAVVGFLVIRLRLPVIFGYLLAGLLIGPYTLKFVSSVETVQSFSDIGVTLLMFSIGVESSLSELRPVRAISILGGSLQIVITIGLGLVVGLALGWSYYQSLFLGAVISISSTAVALKTLMDQGELDTVHGRVSLGIMIVQDLSVVGLITILTSAQHPGLQMLPDIAWTIARAGLLIVAALIVARLVIPSILGAVALLDSRELFAISLVALAVGAAVGSVLSGLVLSLGAFIAGLAISESEFRHQVLATISTLRDVFAALFFVSVGMLINPVFIYTNLGVLAAVVTAIVVGKFMIGAIITMLFRYSGRTAFLVGATLIQIGEFSIVMARVGLVQGLVSESFYSIILAAALLTIVITPFAMRYIGRIYSSLITIPAVRPIIAGPAEVILPHYTYALSDHVLICGYGRVGRTVGLALGDFEKPFF